MAEWQPIEVGHKFISRRGNRIAVVQYRSANGDVGYRIKFAKRVYHATAENFLRNYTPLSDPPKESTNV